MPPLHTARMSGAAVFCQVFLPYALGHFLSTLLRNVNAVLAPQLAQAASLSPGELGLLTSAFFCAFALAQLPVGIALDRFGPRRVQAALLLLAALACVLFAQAGTLAGMAAARFLLGLGLGGCFMAAVKAMAAWAPPARMPSISGYLIAAGGLGSAAATLPVRSALEHTDWRGVFLGLGLIVAMAALVVWAVAPRDAGRAAAGPRVALADVYRDPAFRRTASLVLVPHTVFFGVQGLWIGRWLSDAGRMPEGTVAYLLYLSMAAVIFGAIAVGMITEWAAKRGIAPLEVAAAGVALFIGVQVAIAVTPGIGFSQLAVLFTLVGTITGIEYSIVAQSMPATLTGRASTCLNLLIFVGAFLVQLGFGLVVDCWDSDATGRYPAVAYQVAFAACIALQLPGLALYAWRRYLQPSSTSSGSEVQAMPASASTALPASAQSSSP
ncbi:MFS transporter [Pseudoduganella sp. GCM10020061]|uniref:MFS transporter n=1 Tax=Pseudoduganella sp. GCM10020061 TaxID=3317345 RepID=UPI003638BCF8